MRFDLGRGGSLISGRDRLSFESETLTNMHTDPSKDQPVANQRQCPTISGDAPSLITHSIDSATCIGRQSEFYHKCHRCLFRGKAADFTLESSNAKSAKRA